MPSTTSNTLSPRRCTRWFRFICSCGWPCSLNDLRRLRRFEGHILDVDLLDAELRAGGLGGRVAAVEGLVGHRGGTPAGMRKRRRLSHGKNPRRTADFRDPSSCPSPAADRPVARRRGRPRAHATRSNPAFFSRFAASVEACPVRHTGTTGSDFAEASSLFSGSNWLTCTFFEPGMWPFSKSAIGCRSTTSALSRFISAVSSAGRRPLKPRNRCATSLPTMARVRPTRASDRSSWRPAKTSSASKVT